MLSLSPSFDRVRSSASSASSTTAPHATAALCFVALKGMIFAAFDFSGSCDHHARAAGLLRSTFGVVAYEEHILQICEAFAGLASTCSAVL